MLTGKMRNRKTWYGKIVVQVEVKLGFTDKLQCHAKYRWKDATIEDMQWLLAHGQLFDGGMPTSRQHQSLIAVAGLEEPRLRPTGFKPRIVK